MDENWQSLDLDYDIDEVNDCLTLVSLLKQAKISSFQLQAIFNEQYLLRQFMTEWQAQMYQEEMPTPKKGKQDYQEHLIPSHLSKPIKMAVKIGAQKARIFNQIYLDQLEIQEQKHDYKIRCQRQGFVIHMSKECEFSTLCRNKLFDMNEKLQLYYSKNKNVIKKLRYSLKIKERIKQRQIYSTIIETKKQTRAIFFSTIHKQETIQKQIEQQLNKDISIINFHQSGLKKAQNDCIFSLITQAISQELKYLDDYFDVNSEINPTKHCIIFHNQHQVFQKELISAFFPYLNQIVLLSIKSTQIRSFDNHIKQNMKQWPFLYGKMNSFRSHTFLALKKPFEKQALIDFLKLFTMVVNNQNFQLNIFFHHYEKPDKIIAQLTELTEQHFLHFFNQINVSQYNCKFANIRLKDYSEPIKIKRQKQVIDFLTNFLLPQDITNTQLNNSQLRIQQVEELSRSYTYQRINNSSMAEKQIFLWLKLQFQFPKRVIFSLEEQRANKMMIKRRDRNLEDLFNRQSGYKFKVYCLQIGQHINLPKQVDEHPKLAKKAFLRGQLNQSYSICAIQKFDIKEEGAIIFEAKKLNQMFVPTHSFQRIS